MPSPSFRNNYRRPPPEHEYPRYEPNIPLTTVFTVVVGGVLVLYFLLADFLALPSPLDAVALMAGRLFGPAARERLQNAFATTPRRVVSQVRDRAASIVGCAPPRGDGSGAVGGLWNVGNTCYQNAVLQALASLEGLRAWLKAIEGGITAETLAYLIEDLNTVSERPKVETASALITQAGGGARGWMFNEQQDAQEFLQGLMGVLEKEVGVVDARRKRGRAVGLEGVLGRKQAVARNTSLRSPFEGLLAQRVGCLECGYVESLSLQPFTTLSLPIPNAWATTLEDCLHGFTEIEQIPEVDCDKCTLLSIRDKLIELRASLSPAPTSPSPLADSDLASDNENAPPPSASQQMAQTITTRLEAIEEALDDDNFSPRIPGVKLDGSLKVSSTKTKQVMIARAPQLLVLHTNRSKFDPLTGTVGKNYAAVRFPSILDLGELGVVTRHEQLSTDPGRAISDAKRADEKEEDDVMAAGGEGVYELQAVVAHFGGHHNGHYVAYRSWAGRWWRISDHEVIACQEEVALGASNAFMLFYERVPAEALALRREREAAEPPIEALIASLPASDDEAEEEPRPNVYRTPQRLPTPPQSDGEDDSAAAPTPTPQSPPLSPSSEESEAEDDDGVGVGEHDDDEGVPELSRDVSSRDSSPETPPPTALPPTPRSSRTAKGKRKGRERVGGGVGGATD